MVSVDKADPDVLQFIWVDDALKIPQSLPIHSSRLWSLI